MLHIFPDDLSESISTLSKFHISFLLVIEMNPSIISKHFMEYFILSFTSIKVISIKLVIDKNIPNIIKCVLLLKYTDIYLFFLLILFNNFLEA